MMETQSLCDFTHLCKLIPLLLCIIDSKLCGGL